MYSPTMSRTFSVKNGSLDSLNVVVRWGLSAKVRQRRDTVLCDNPVLAARPRVDQCVLPSGLLSSVSRTARSTCASVIFRGAPGRG